MQIYYSGILSSTLNYKTFQNRLLRSLKRTYIRLGFFLTSFIFFIFFLQSCHLDPHPRPEHLIPREKMKEILSDLYLTDTYSTINFENKFGDYNRLQKYKSGLQWIYKKYGIDEEQFLGNLDYYLYQSKDINWIYNSLLEDLKAKKIKIDKDSALFRKRDSIAHPEKIAMEKKVKDSLANVAKINAIKARKADSIQRIKMLKEAQKINRNNRFNQSLPGYPNRPGMNRPYRPGINQPYRPGINQPYRSGINQPYRPGMNPPFGPGRNPNQFPGNMPNKYPNGFAPRNYVPSYLPQTLRAPYSMVSYPIYTPIIDFSIFYRTRINP